MLESVRFPVGRFASFSCSVLVSFKQLLGNLSRVIGHLREHVDQPLVIEEVARELGMSVSGFHHHFKSVTAMTPLQYQKQIRLQEARRLMLGETLDAATAGFRVGYRILPTSAATTKNIRDTVRGKTGKSD